MLPLLIPAAIKVSLAVAVALPSLVAHEKIVRKPYVDAVGVRTVCLGETEGIEDREYTDTECLLMAAERLARDFEAPIRACTDTWDTLPLPTQTATLSFVYNIGTHNYCKVSSTAKAFRRGDIRTGCEKMRLWNKGKKFDPDSGRYDIDPATGKPRLIVIRGLDNRRKVESELCLQGAA